jgi:tetratricopeptide (TPR) repeat protein
MTMRRTISVLLVVVSSMSFAQAERKAPKDTELKKKETNLAPDKSLAGDVTRKKEKREEAPALKYDQFRTGVELQVAAKRRDQIKDLSKIIELSSDKAEKPSLLFRLGELYWEESKYFSFEANRKDDDKIRAMNADDKAGIARAEQEKAEIEVQARDYAKKAIEQYTRIVQEFKDFDRTDEVLYFLGLNMMDMGDEKRALVAYNRLISKYPKSKYLPDAYLAVAEFHFNGSKGKREELEKALENYKSAAKFTDNKVYGYALYKQGWCYFNMSDFDKAMDQFKSVVLYAQFAGTEEVEGGKGKGSRAGLAKEARGDYVRAYSRAGTPNEAREKFSKLSKEPEDLRLMTKQLANLYYDDGKDKEAALTYNMLIAERPISPEAPGFQSRIVDCVMRAGNKQMTVQQVRRLVKVMDDVLKGNPKLEDKDKKSLDEARELSERTISKLAVDWHNEGKKTRDEPTFEFANAVYADYLTLFPTNPKAYDLRFFWAELLNDNLNKYDKAAEQYGLVFSQDIDRITKGGGEKPGKYLTLASYDTILAWDEVVKKAQAEGKIKVEATTDPTRKGTIPPEKKALLDACERYLKYIEKGDKRVEIAYKAAKIYYDYNFLDEAVARFAEIALKYPDYKFADGARAGEVTANLVLDSYNLLGDWTKVNEWSRKFYAEEKLATGAFREELAKYIEQSSFKLINALESKKENLKAAEAYMTFVSEWPKSDLADKALFNAAIDFYNARALDRAIEVRKQLIQKHPKSQYVPQAMFALAEGYEAIAEFDPAADYYEAYAVAYEKNKGGKKGAPAPRAAPKKGGKDDKKPDADQVWEEGKAQDALFNAGIFREGLGTLKQALKDREKYLELWPTSKDAEAVEKSILDLNEKLGAWGKVTKGLEDYEKKYVKDSSKVLIAEGRIATIYEEKQKNAKAAKGVYQRIFDYYEKLPKRLKDGLEIQALDSVARASFIANEDDWKKYSNLKLRWSSMNNIGELKSSIKTKSDALVEVQKVYTKTVAFKSADPAICALYKIGLAFDQLAEQLSNFPVPKGLPEEVLIELRPQFEHEAEPLKKTAADAFGAAVTKSQELDVFNPCTIASLEMLRSKYAPDRFPRMREDTFELKPAADKQMAIGADLLTSIQNVPTVSAEKANELRAKTREVGAREVANTSPEVDLTAKDSPPPPTPKKAEPAPVKEKESPKAVQRTNTPAATPTTTPKSKNADAEPEDTL